MLKKRRHPVCTQPVKLCTETSNFEGNQLTQVYVEKWPLKQCVCTGCSCLVVSTSEVTTVWHYGYSIIIISNVDIEGH